MNKRVSGNRGIICMIYLFYNAQQCSRIKQSDTCSFTTSTLGNFYFTHCWSRKHLRHVMYQKPFISATATLPLLVITAHRAMVKRKIFAILLHTFTIIISGRPSDRWPVIFHDNFDGPLNLKKWGYVIHNPGWVNGEKQAYNYKNAPTGRIREITNSTWSSTTLCIHFGEPRPALIWSSMCCRSITSQYVVGGGNKVLDGMVMLSIERFRREIILWVVLFDEYVLELTVFDSMNWTKQMLRCRFDSYIFNNSVGYIFYQQNTCLPDLCVRTNWRRLDHVNINQLQQEIIWEMRKFYSLLQLCSILVVYKVYCAFFEIPHSFTSTTQ